MVRLFVSYEAPAKIIPSIADYRDLNAQEERLIDYATGYKLPRDLVLYIKDYATSNILCDTDMRDLVSQLGLGPSTCKLVYSGDWHAVSFHGLGWHKYKHSLLLYQLHNTLYIRYANHSYRYYKWFHNLLLQCTSQEWLGTGFGGIINIFLVAPRDGLNEERDKNSVFSSKACQTTMSSILLRSGS